jgi:hypothetical protein
VNLSQAIQDALLTMDAVTALVGDDPLSARMWANWERVNAYPCIIVEIDREDPQNDLQGRGGLVVAEVTITCRAETCVGAVALREAVKLNGTDPGTGLAGYSGDFDAVLDGTASAAAPKGDGSTAHWYDQVMSFTVLYQEAA